MRAIVILYPTNKHGTRTEYTSLRKHLEDDGFRCLIPEIYMRVITSHEIAEKHRKRLESHIPDSGTVLYFTMTEKQFNKIEYLVGEPSLQERLVGANTVITL